MEQDVPFAATLPPGIYLLGLLGTTNSGSSTGSSLIAVAPGSWNGTTFGMSQGIASTFRSMGVVSAAGTTPFPGVGSTSATDSGTIATIAWQSISSGQRAYFQLGMLG